MLNISEIASVLFVQTSEILKKMFRRKEKQSNAIESPGNEIRI